MSRRSPILLVFLLLLTLVPALAHAQVPAQRAKAIVTVVDPSGGFIPGATVTLVGLENATKANSFAPVKTDDKGIATFSNLIIGRYAIQGEFPGFQLGLVRDVRLKAGDNKHVIILPLKQMSESVTVGQDSLQAASTRPSLGTALTREQIDALSDDPDELQRQINDLAGPNATIRVDSFEGSQLPPKAMIKSIHITRDQYAAENHFIGGLFIDIVTQPGIGKLRGNGNVNYNGSQLNSHTAFVPEKPSEQNRSFGFGMGGTIVPQKADFSINFNGQDSYTQPNTFIYTAQGRQTETLSLHVPRRQASINGTVNYAITKDQTIRVSAFVGGNGQDNLGIGGNNVADRAYSQRARNRQVNFQEVGPIGRRLFLNTRGRFFYNHIWANSLLETPTIVINDAQTRGGAQRRGGSYSKSLSLQSDLDYIRGINSWRAGVQFDGTWYDSNDNSNYLGTYTFTGVPAYAAGKPTFFSKRIGDPTIKYSNMQAGFYLQDDIRISKTLTLSPGIRYEVQTHVTDYNGFGPRFGATWSPFKSGKTSIRGGGGIFYDWLGVGTYAQTILIDGHHQQDLQITNPSYPDPGNIGNITTTNKYLLGPDYVMPRSLGINIGVDQTITSRIRINAGYTFTRGTQVAHGNNLNAPVNGVRQDPLFLNVIETVSDASYRSHSAYVGTSFSLTTPKPGASQPRFDWKRLSFNGSYSASRYRSNGEGPFTPPASGTLATEWGPSGRGTHFVSVGINSGALKNANINVSLNTSSGGYYNVTTGFDNNGDLMFNDRPAGVSRNSAQVPVWNVGLRAGFSYSFTFGKGVSNLPPGIMINGGDRGQLTVTTMAPSAAGRYRVSLNVNANNITNRNNYGGYLGNMANLLGFGQPTSSGEPRRINVSMSFGF